MKYYCNEYENELTKFIKIAKTTIKHNNKKKNNNNMNK